MKKLIVLFCITVFGFCLNSVGQGFLDQDKMNSPEEFRDNGYSRVAIVFRHHPIGSQECTCPRCKCEGCTCPVGICICFYSPAVSLTNTQSLTQDQLDEGYGIAWVKIDGNYLHLVFEVTNDDNGSMIVNSSPTVDSNDAPKFGVSTPFHITNNTYTVIKTKYSIGETVVDITY